MTRSIFSVQHATSYLYKLFPKDLLMRRQLNSVADLRAGARDAPLLGDPNSFNFMQFLENLAKSYVGAPWSVGAPASEKSWIRHCKGLLLFLTVLQEFCTR